ncbi:MAG TPA: hybrid sensor histidine kinase/response regulator [Cyanobacteria bacterium UBA11149]|nr:hybrid sensor histidine kinase/response regulator [Cyanobacteria bacterium UBA11367]HBE57299.1 hybrid sensor histidine kinase/response regulator [Cyanobacteria bacterium UBA11366]HBK63386.1 hybrid sensor histidine kinase/response regulator [Cyanobacteria bacterium UBA11166]HBR72521.1 hybrid sensor histidine kinase/response regulator [Cyanobacteria bacterium UBA11159]HBS68348.1 hybrid sensor histidine kinase/response regulator [Cyanobacteria bacterium UBA11153]HBW92422.1 hybrid sensor histid
MKKILVIEDEQAVRENLMDLLDAENFTVVAADNGCAGVDLAQEHLPDLIICDVMMPKLDGFGVLTELRKKPSTATIPFVFLSARADKNDWRHGMELGADDYVTKPFTAEELLKAISARFEKKATIERQQAKKMDWLRNSITKSMPHAMRSPLTHILGFSQFIVEEVDTLERQDIKEMAGKISTSAERLHKLIQNFLLYAELELIATDPERIKTLRNSHVKSAAPAIETIVWDWAKRLDRGGDIEIDLQDSTIQIAKIKLEKIVAELIDNAFKYSSPGTPVHVSSTIIDRGNPAKPFYALSVTDKGCGMISSQIAQLEANQEFENKLYEQTGSGLGLIISKRLAQLLGGELTIESIPNLGTTVRVVLPI